MLEILERIILFPFLLILMILLVFASLIVFIIGGRDDFSKIFECDKCNVRSK